MIDRDSSDGVRRFARVSLATAVLVVVLVASVGGGLVLAWGALGSVPPRACGSPDCSTEKPRVAGSDPSSFQDAASATPGWAWTTISPPANGVSGAGLATDGSLGEAVLFGGNSSSGLQAATSIYNYGTDAWTTLSSVGTAPSARAYAAMAADPSSQTALLFGGEIKTNPVTVDATTWKFQFSTDTWSRAPNGTAPPARADAAFAIDPTGSIGLLFGGWNPSYRSVGVLTYADTWEINLTSLKWTNVTKPTGTSPPPLRGAELAWDPSAGKFDLVGGCYPCSDRVWQFDPGTRNWTELAAEAQPPPARMDAVWQWDPDEEVGLLFGGTDGSTIFNDTFVFNPASNSWTPIIEPYFPSARSSAASGWLGVPSNSTLLVVSGNGTAAPAPSAWRLSVTANVSVLVENATSLAPLPGAYVTLGNASGPETSAIANSSGQAVLTNIAPTESTLNTSAPGFATVTQSVWIPSGSNLSITVHLSSVPPSSVHVRVVNTSGAPVGEAIVELLVHGALIVSPPLVTPADGWANYTDVPASVGVIQASAPGYRTANISADFVSSQTETDQLTLTPLPMLEVFAIGIVQTSALPLRGVEITVNHAEVGSTGTNGWLNASVNATGTVEVEGQVASFSPGFANVTLPPAGVKEVTLTLLSLPLGTLELNVVDAENDTPVAQANTTVRSVGALAVGPVTATAVGTPLGTISVSLAPGNYTYSVSAPGYATYAEGTPVTITSGNTSSYRVPLVRTAEATVHFIVIDHNTSLPIDNASLTLASRFAGLTDLYGWLNLSQVAPGTNVSIIATAAGYISNLTRGSFLAGQTDFRFQINLTELPPVHEGARGANLTGLSFAAAGAFPLWELLLIPIVATAGALLYLIVLRVPTIPTLAPPGPRTEEKSDRSKP